MSLDKKIIFIVGASRSGTTMLSRILGQHSQIFALNELHVFGDLIYSESLYKPLNRPEQTKLALTILQREEYGIWAADQPLKNVTLVQSVLAQLDSDTATAAEVFKESVLAVAEAQGNSSVAEQTPRNVFFADALLKAYPQAHFVHMVRDPRAVLASQKNKWRRKFLGGDEIPTLEMIRMWTNYHPFTLSKLWLNANRLAIKHESNDRFHVIKFEGLLEAPELTLRNLCDAIKIDFEAKMLDIEHLGSSHQHNTSRVAGISNTTVESWKQNLTAAEQLVSEKLCAPVMSHYGYVASAKGQWPVISMLMLLLRFPLHVLGVAVFNFKRAFIQLRSISARSSGQ